MSRTRHTEKSWERETIKSPYKRQKVSFNDFEVAYMLSNGNPSIRL